MSHYQQQVLNSTPYYFHWLTKLKFNHKYSDFKCLNTNTIIKNDNLISTTSKIDNTTIYHSKPLNVFFIVLRVENDDYILLTTNKDSDIGTGYQNFLQLPTWDIDNIDENPIQMIHLNINIKEAIPLKIPSNFNLDNNKFFIKSSPHKWKWFTQEGISTKKDDYENNLIGWWVNPSFTSQYCKFYQIIKKVTFPQFFKIIREIEDKNEINKEKFVIVHRHHLLSYSPDLRTSTALFLTNQSNKYYPYFLNRTDIYYSIFFSFVLTIFLLSIYSLYSV